MGCRVFSRELLNEIEEPTRTRARERGKDRNN